MKIERLNKRVGFILQEVLLGIMVMAILASVAAPHFGGMLESSQLKAEQDSMNVFRDEIINSFNDGDMSRNISAVAVDGLTVPNYTVFDDATGLNAAVSSPYTVVQNSWLDKLARFRSQGVVPSTVIHASQDNGASSLWFNSRRWRRVMLAGPTDEASQRFLMISVMTPVSTPPVFPNNGDVFNEIWNNNWDGGGANAPAAWAGAGRLTPADFAAWNAEGNHNRTLAGRMIVRRINQPKYEVIVVNTHTTDSVWIDIGPHENAMSVSAGAGVVRSSSIAFYARGVPAGRQIVVRRGTDSSTSVEVQRFMLTAQSTITVQ
jgi:type II secretory pathway pseudopilin PulG